MTDSQRVGLGPSCAAWGAAIDAAFVHICSSSGTAQTEGAGTSRQEACGVDAGLEELSAPLALLCGLRWPVAALLIKEQHPVDAHWYKQLRRKAPG